MNSYILGIDIGSTAVSLALTDENKNIVKTSYCFHKGEIEKTLEKELENFDLSLVSGVAATTSTPETVKRDFECDNQAALITAAKELNNSFDSILFVGGEKFGLLDFDENGNYKNFKTNTSCAAGTGSFLDQQAGRLNFSGTEELSETAYKNKDNFPLIASRCAVFAKTDLIHAQQEGYSYEEISDGLCYGLAKNITDTLFSGNKKNSKVLFCGGVSLNRAVKKHLEKILDIKLYSDGYSNVYSAIGACFMLCDEIKNKNVPVSKITKETIFKKKEKEKSLFYEPLELKLSKYPDFSSLERFEFEPSNSRGNNVETDIYEEIKKDCSLEAFLGIDIGSTSTKAVLINNDKKAAAGFYTRTAGNPLKAVKSILECIDYISKEKNCEIKIKGCSTTGSGRKFIGKILGADQCIDEITAHAKAASEINPDVDTIIEIGGQDAKFTTLKNGLVTFSVMNNVCAAGTGSFIEEQAKKLNVNISEYAKRTDKVKAPLSSDRCTVFMERDINHYLAEGYSVNEVLASVLHSVRENYLVKVASESLIGNHVYFQGATAKNRSLVAAFEQRLKKPIHVSPLCHLTGAFGAGLILMEEQVKETSFRGIDIYKKEIPLTSEVCGLCNNHCKITIADIDGEKAAYGFLCGRDYDTKKYVNKNISGFDLLKERRKIENKSLSNTVDNENSPVIGIPFSLHLVEDYARWKKFFSLLGIKTVSSESYKESVKKGKKISETEFCAPASSMFGHVDYLLEKSDYVFVPFYLEEKVKNGKSQYCYYTQYIPSLLKKIDEKRVLTPLINYLYTGFHSKIQLYKMLESINIKKSFFEISAAFDKALDTKEENIEKFKKLYEEQINKADDISVVLLGRPYTVLSDKMNNKIPEIFGNLGIKTFYQDMISVSDEDKAEIGPLLNDIHWKYVSKILQTAQKAAKTKNLYPVYITSFKCSPDSFGLKFFKELMAKHEKPYLVLELDEHDSSVGYETRIEAAVRAFRNHSESENKKEISKDYEDIFFKPEKNLKDKHLIFPNWDSLSCPFLAQALRREGISTYLIEETDSTISRSMKFNTGQCIPANAIAQGFVETIEKNNLDPKDCVLWMSKANFCNLRLYPNFIHSLLKSYGNGMEKAKIFHGELTFTDISIRASFNAYFAHMFGGMIRKMGCKTRPYEIKKGETDSVIEKSKIIMEQAFIGNMSKENAVKQVVEDFKKIKIKSEKRPKAAIFGDIYVRDNDVMNQNLIKFIEENGGEVLTTPYTELAKVIAPMYFKKWFNERLFLNLVSVKVLSANMRLVEKKYMKYFNEILKEEEHFYDENPEEILADFGIRPENAGESMENILKIHYLAKHYPDLSLFVQANPAFCCPSLVTESMKSVIENKTSIPVVTITYDGTGGVKNQSIVPYLKFSRIKGDLDENEKVKVS